VRGSHGIDEWLLRYVGEPVRRPQMGEALTASPNLQWHRREALRLRPLPMICSVITYLVDDDEAATSKTPTPHPKTKAPPGIAHWRFSSLVLRSTPNPTLP